MKPMRLIAAGLALVSTLAGLPSSASATEAPPYLASFSKPAAGDLQIIFRGASGPFRIQSAPSLDPTAVWVDIPSAVVTELQTGVYLAMLPNQQDPAGSRFYRVISEASGFAELKGWTLLVRVSPPANGLYFTQGESPVVTVTILDTLAQGLSRDDFSTLNLYLYGPQDPKKTVTAVKLLNASTNRASTPHHYIDLKQNPAVQVNQNVLTYPLQPISTELPGTYTVSLWARLAADNIQQMMQFVDIQIGTTNVETAVVAKISPPPASVPKCASCHEGPISGKTYLHHIDPGYSPTGNWSLDFEPVRSCKSCHNNDGYAAYTDASAPGGRVPDPIARRVHGVHMGQDLKLAFNTNSVNGDFKDYAHLEFPADVRNCTTCHLDDRWKTQPSRMACGACHDTIWFGASTAVPTGMLGHPGGEQDDDTLCSVCHAPDTDGFSIPVAVAHKVTPPAIDRIDVSMTPPANGNYYVAGEKPVVTLVIRDDTGTNAIDHTKVTDANFSTASLFVYGPRSLTLPVLTSAARNVNSKVRASVTSSIPGPWAINGKTFTLAVNGSAPQNITMVGASNLVTAAEVVASLNSVITNLNGGAKASVSGANVMLKTLIQGAGARFEIYNGDVTTAMGWKRPPNTVMEPDVTIAASSLPSNDLRALSDPLDYSDPMVTRTSTNITYLLDDVAGLTPGTYGIYVYHLPKAGKIPGLTNLTGIGHLMFQVGTATPEKTIATNCKNCHGDTIWHFSSGPIHAEPFDPDYCKACHDYGHNAPGDMFKNQGGTSLNGWSGYGAVPLKRRVHGVHFAHYLQHSEEIYANATKDTFGNIIFPQDVRNCTKCHAESDTWKQKPSRVACLACHDTDADKAHGKLMTFMPDPNDPYGPLAEETCDVCHGANAEFAPDKVHSISNPYVPPYPR